MNTTIRFAAVCAALMLAVPAAAEPAAREEAAWRWLDQAMAPTLNQEQRAKLTWAAYNNAAGSLCNEVAVEDAKLGDLLSTLLPAPDAADVTPEQRRHLEASLMLHLGAATGILAAENADNLTEFCGEAVALRDAKEPNNNLFLPATVAEEPAGEKPKE
ncbi:MAG: hypothetical protein AB7O49_17485 [Sphingomonadales bacterium]